MTFIVQEEFGGIAPKVDPRKLADKLAQMAANCLFENHNLRPLRLPKDLGITLGADTKTVYPYLGAWLQFTTRAKIVPSPVPNDVHERLYITNDGPYPYVKTGAGTWRLGIPRPWPPTVAAPEVVEDPENLLEIEDVYYVCTFVDAFGAEGPPSWPAGPITRVRDQTLSITPPTKPTGNYNFGPGAKIRFYRSNTGTEQTYFQYAFEVGINTTAAVEDTVPNAALQEVIPSATWLGPPDDDTDTWPDGPLKGITLAQNGVAAGFAKRTVYLCEPYLLHAWPSEYTVTVRDNILGLVWISGGLLVVTDGAPVILAGTYPASMTPVIPDQAWPCNAAESIVDMGGWAMYNSPDGFVGVMGQTFRLLTEELADNNWWSANVPANGLGGCSEGRYVYFWAKSPSEKGAMIFDPAAGVNALTTCTMWSDVAYSDRTTHLLNVRSNSSRLSQFDYGTATFIYGWQSKIYVLQGATNFAYLEVIANSYPVVVTLRAGPRRNAMTTVFSGTITGPITALPDGFAYDHWDIQVAGVAEVSAVSLFEDMSEVG